jgi:cytoskeletal protein CcmA (bactofilin family)
MFSSDKNKTGSSGGEFSINSIASGSAVRGDITAITDMRIDGTLDGNISCEERFILGQKGKVTGDIKCKSAVIHGSVTGSLIVSESLEIGSTANLQGDVKTTKLIISEGAIFNVRCEMLGIDKPSPKSK